jgi:hypothetical protein
MQKKQSATLAILLTLVIGLLTMYFGSRWKGLRDLTHPSEHTSAPAAISRTPVLTEEACNPFHEPESTNLFDLDQTNWRGVTSVDTNKVIHGIMISRGIVWEIRCDRDNSKIYTCYPAGWTAHPPVIIPPSNTHEWRIKAGQVFTNAQFCALIIERSHANPQDIERLDRLSAFNP